MDELIYNKHYITLNENGCIVDGFSDAFRTPSATDICINEFGGYQFRLFHNGEENPVLFNSDGVPLYRWNGSVIARGSGEIEADRVEPEPTEMEQLRADVDYIAIMTGVEL